MMPRAKKTKRAPVVTLGSVFDQFREELREFETLLLEHQRALGAVERLEKALAEKRSLLFKRRVVQAMEDGTLPA